MSALPVAVLDFPLARDHRLDDLLGAFLAGRSPQTLRAYAQDLADFTAWTRAAGTADAVSRLLDSGPGAANATALYYRADLVARGLAAATVNRRLAALRSLVRLARTLAVVTWTLDVASVRAAAYRDTRGPGVAGVRALMDALAARQDAKGVRDRAILRLLYDLALRRSEVVSLDMADVDLEAATVHVLGKGSTERVTLTLPSPTREALAAWLVVRGPEPGPLFVNYDHAGKGLRLTATSLYRIVRHLGACAGLTVRPHGLRHTAITAALDVTGGDLRRVQRFSRHRDVRTIGLYDDNRLDLGGEVARQVADTV